MTNSDSANCDSSSNFKVFHCSHLCSYTILIISAICCLPPERVSKARPHWAKIPVFWVTGNWSEKLVSAFFVFFLKWQSPQTTNFHTLRRRKFVCGVPKPSPIRPTPFSLYTHIFIYILKLKPCGIKKGDSTVQHLWMSPEDEQASS